MEYCVDSLFQSLVPSEWRENVVVAGRHPPFVVLNARGYFIVEKSVRIAIGPFTRKNVETI